MQFFHVLAICENWPSLSCARDNQYDNNGKNNCNGIGNKYYKNWWLKNIDNKNNKEKNDKNVNRNIKYNKDKKMSNKNNNNDINNWDGNVNKQECGSSVPSHASDRSYPCCSKYPGIILQLKGGSVLTIAVLPYKQGPAWVVYSILHVRRAIHFPIKRITTSWNGNILFELSGDAMTPMWYLCSGLAIPVHPSGIYRVKSN